MSTVQTWKWEMLHPHQEDTHEAIPCARDIWNGMLAYDGSLYVFGGATLKYGPAKTHGDLTTLGTLDDLWRYDPATAAWTQLEEDDGRSGFSPSVDRPCGRVLPAWVAVKDRFYLFGGLSVLSAGWQTCLLNDLWSYDPLIGKWELLEPHDGRALETPDSAGARPTILAAMGVACVGTGIYLMAGWGRTPQVVLSAQLWRYDVVSRNWEHLGPRADRREVWPSKRYCPAFVSWEDKLYLWGGRDTQDQRPEFYNDLWEYDPKTARWTCVQEHRPDDPHRPSPRYGMGHARVGPHWYVFGGLDDSEGRDGPQLNDLWRCDLRSAAWECVCPHNGAKDYTANATRPGVRRVPGMAGMDEEVYLFAGIDLASGEQDDGPTIGFNDLWRGRCV